MPAKPDKTAADYLAIAACPALIMLLVGSLVFFLLQIGYTGEWLGRLRWTLFWFVFAMVLVSRIAIEQSPGAAFLYGLALAGATSLLLTQYLGFLWGVWLLLALIWWTSNKIVWDCTLIDEDQDASGLGLLQTSRAKYWLQRQLSRVRAVSESAAGPDSPAGSPALPVASPSPPLARRLAGSKAKPRPARKPQEMHAPGLSVLYFSFASVPVFGVGELLLRRGDIAGRRFSFVMLMVYLAAALSLLLLTSFLGLRRYLRQRHLVMPMAMASTWVRSGVSLLLAVLALALLLPRPPTPYSLAAWVPKLTSPNQEASEFAPRTSQGAHGQSSVGARGQEGDEETTAQAGSQQESAARTANPTPQTTPGGGQAPFSSPENPLQFETWLSYFVAALLLAFLAYRFWPRLRPVPKTVRRPPDQRTQAAPAVALANPFLTSQADQMSIADLVRYSFTGLKFWAQSRGFVSDPSETPLELAERLRQREPVLANEILLVSSYYSNLEYGSQLPSSECIVVLKRLWSVIGF